MQLRFSLFVLTLLVLSQIELKALDAIDHNKQYIYVMDKGQVHRYTYGLYDEKGKFNIGADSNFINRFYNDFAKPFFFSKAIINVVPNVSWCLPFLVMSKRFGRKSSSPAFGTA